MATESEPNPSHQIMKVSALTKASRLAGAIAATLRNKSSLELVAIGTPANNQAVKALAIANSYLGQDDEPQHLFTIPTFSTEMTPAGERTSVRWYINSAPGAFGNPHYFNTKAHLS